MGDFMSRMERVKDALTSTLNKLRDQIETSHKNGKIPADYSLGFTNGLIFIDHHINMREGSPKFYDRTTSIGTLPKPVALRSGDSVKDEQTYQFLVDSTILRARQVIGSIKVNTETKTADITDETIKALMALMESVIHMDKFVTEKLELEEEKHGQEKISEQSENNGESGNFVEQIEELQTKQTVSTHGCSR